MMHRGKYAGFLRLPVILSLLVFGVFPVTGCATNSCALRFGGMQVAIDADHNIVYGDEGKQQRQVIEVDMPHKDTLHFVTLGDTNVVKLERYHDAWVLLVQTSRQVDAEAPPGLGCETRFKALVVRDDGGLFLSEESNGGIGCPPIDRDRPAFTTLADPYVSKD